jgi:NitT/TauT family transport system ATP-binding protein
MKNGTGTDNDGNGLRKGELEVRNVEKIFRVPGCPACVALKDCSLTVERGKLTVLVGPSGSGKSTLANIIAGYDTPTSGNILLDGEPARGSSSDRIMIFQETALWPWMTILKNVTFGPTLLGGMSKSLAVSKARALLETVGLEEFSDKYPAQLSGGMQRRAEVCRALLMEPKVMILDEPFRGLDVMTRELMQEYLLKLYQDTGLTMFFITSEIDEALFLADRILVMTQLPGTIKTVVEVDLPRPRELHVTISEKYRLIKAQVMDSLYEEGAKIFKHFHGADGRQCACPPAGTPD